MRTLALEGFTLAAVLALALTGPWDATDSNYVAGFSAARYMAAGLVFGTAFYAGRHRSWAEALVVAAGVCFLGVVFYVGGSWISRDLGWSSAAGCPDIPGCHSSLFSTLVDSMSYAVPFAVVGATLGGVGYVLLGPYWRGADA